LGNCYNKCVYENTKLFNNKIPCLYAAGLIQHHGSGRLYEQNACNVKFNYYAYNVKFNCYAYNDNFNSYAYK